MSGVVSCQCGCRCGCVCSGLGVVLGVNGEVVKGRNMSQ